ncbi:MAG TPA: ureidoglycolate lyase [Rhizobiales bacterium]|nr:ureidoglycolate lyase [Hyphomicrobiales bacterium]
MRKIAPQPLSASAFAPFGDVIEMAGKADFLINQGTCERFHDLARLDFAGPDGRAAISLARARPSTLPLELSMMERHPLGSQAFIPLSANPFLVIVAADEDGAPGRPLAFLTNGAQGINYLRNTWHGVLSPLDEEQAFIIVDREGTRDNLVEHHFDVPYLVA